MKKFLLLLTTMVQTAYLPAQDLHFSQFYETPLLRNPALAGIFTGQYRIQAVHRNQWQGIKDPNNISHPYQTTGLGAEFKFSGYCMDEDDNNSFTGGVQLLRDRAGDSKLTRTTYLLGLTYRMLTVNDLEVAAGFCGGPVVSHFDPTGLQWDDQYINGQYSPTNPTNQPMPANGKNYWDLGAGLAVSGGDEERYQWYMGGAAYHVNRPGTGFSNNNSLYDSRQKIRWTGNLGLALFVNEFDRFKIYGDMMTQGDQNQYIFGAVYKKRLDAYTNIDDEGMSISFGGLYRFNDAVIPVLNLHWERWTAGFSYDVNVSKLSPASKFRGGFEFALKFRGGLKGIDCNRYGCFN